ncbi:MAG: Y-family DNA polymerase [Prevotella sp.]|nr:Y-family DNA polymerase [Prevotella sp.]
MPILHIDCNSFYASCEVAFRPELKGKPVVVANYNEAGGGIILALTKEAKALGLKRGNPIFQVKDVLEKNHVAIFPANLQKYVDISRRIVSVVQELDMVTGFHRYSVDEFFAEIPAYKDKTDTREYVGIIKEKIEHGTGIPVSCGIASTYTLAKVATWYAKRYAGYKGICVLEDANVEKALKGLPVADVWGVGWRSAPKMKQMGIHTAWDYHQRPKAFVQNRFHVTGVRTWMELHGQVSIDLTVPPKQQTIMHSRTFTYMVQQLEPLKDYIRDFAVAAARKLRDQHSVCRSVTVFANTNRHREDLDQYSNGFTIHLMEDTSDTTAIVKAAQQALEAIYLPYYQYKRAGVILGDIMSDEAVEQDLFASTGDETRKHRRLMEATDHINVRYGMNKVQPASLLHTPNEQKKVARETLNFEPWRNQTFNLDDVIEVK